MVIEMKKANFLVSLMAGIGQSIGAISESFGQAFSSLSNVQQKTKESFRHGSSKSSRNRVGKRGKTWSFVSRYGCAPGYAWFRCRQNNEVEIFKVKPVGDRHFNKLVKRHFGIDKLDCNA